MKKIAIHSVPRSGSSWLGEIINSSPDVSYAFQPLFSYEFKSFLDENSNFEEINTFFEKIANTDDDFIKQKEARLVGEKPNFIKNRIRVSAYKEVRYHYIIENLLKKDPDLKVVGLVRNPYSVINSWFNAPREFRKDLGWLLEEELLDAPKKNMGKNEEYFGLNKWIEVESLFRRLEKDFPEQFYLLEYESLCGNTVNTVKKLYVFLGLEYQKQTHDFLTLKKEVEGTYSVMKDKKDKKETFNFSDSVKKIIYDKIYLLK